MKRLIALSTALLLPLGASYGGDWMVAGSLGMAQGDTAASELNSQLSALGLNATASSTEDNRTAWQLTLGYQYTPRWGVEVGYVDLGKVKTSFSGVTSDVDAFLTTTSDIHPQTAQGWQLSGVFRYPLAQQFGAKARLGGFVWNSDYTLSTATVSRNVSSYGSSVFAGVGVEYTVLRNTVTYLDYDRYTIDGEPVSVLSLGISYRLE
jgi:hypothetical protein